MFLSDYKTLMMSNRKLAVRAVSLTLILALYFIGWHYTSLVFNGSYSVIDVSAQFMARVFWYLSLSVIISSLICAVLMILKKRIMRKIFIGAVMILFSGSEIIRIFDWGALYFGGNHIDGNFWAHAFYADGLVYLVTKQALVLYAAAGLFFGAIYFILKQLSSLTNHEGRL